MEWENQYFGVNHEIIRVDPNPSANLVSVGREGNCYIFLPILDDATDTFCSFFIIKK